VTRRRQARLGPTSSKRELNSHKKRLLANRIYGHPLWRHNAPIRVAPNSSRRHGGMTAFRSCFAYALINCTDEDTERAGCLIHVS
jgi:hypothetical protein